MSLPPQPPPRMDAIKLGVLIKMLESSDTTDRDVAARALNEIPPEDIARLLSEPRLVPEAIEYFARHAGQRHDWIKALLGNPSLSEEDRAHLTAASVSSSPKDDEAGEDEGNLNIAQRIMQMNVGQKIKTAMKGDKEARTILIKDTNRDVYMAVLKNPGLKENEVEMLTRNTGTNVEILRAIANNREWVASRNILNGLVMNPKTPVNLSIRFLSRLGRKDVEFIAKSRSLPVALRNNARRMISSKGRK